MVFRSKIVGVDAVSDIGVKKPREKLLGARKMLLPGPRS
jgi:hypothetical protein